MALFKNAATEWEKTMTENDLDQMEAQGLDVSKYREKLAARRAKEAEEAKRDKELYKNLTNLYADSTQCGNRVFQKGRWQNTLVRKK